ncbi:alpha-1-acid glycoprotein 1 [Sarcophilus harrisii]|uniref:Orosomucoid 1 n=1 Tax=Sarcophilus harrisii TaxID=9305 RepID=A0A7N4V0E3_SARHA|nr:alpha-1-acid glycoprotein 1 [Sarcophilus harrisii]
MLLGWTLFLLSLAPLLMGQQPDCVSVTPAFNDTILDQLSGKWYYIASVFEFLPYKEEAQSLQSSFFYMIPNKTEDIILAKEYNTIGDKCVYQDFELPFNRTNGTIFKIDSTKQHSAQVALTQDLNALYFVYFANGKVRPGLALCVRTQKASEEQLKEFQKMAKCLGYQEEAFLFTDSSKDKCEPLEKEHNQKERKEAKDGFRTEELS